jgi:hypothetical protein
MEIAVSQDGIDVARLKEMTQLVGHCCFEKRGGRNA